MSMTTRLSIRATCCCASTSATPSPRATRPAPTWSWPRRSCPAHRSISRWPASAPANLQQAEAQLQQAKANQSQADRDYKRQHSVDPRATTQTNVDQATAQLQSANAAVANADAQVKIASLVQQSIQAAEDTGKQRQ